MTDSTVRPLVIRGGMFKWLELCERRVWLDEYGDVSQRVEVPPTAREWMDAGVLHEQIVQDAVSPPGAEVVYLAGYSWAERVQSTLDAMQSGVHTIMHGCLETELYLPELDRSVLLRGEIDRMMRTRGHSQFGAWAYMPVEIKMRQKSHEADRLQLDLYLYLLQAVLGDAPVGEVWLGRNEYDRPAQRMQHELNEEQFYNAVLRLASILTTGETPPIWLSKPCDSCHWQESCTQIALRDRDITLLPQLTKPVWQQMRAHGWTNLDQLMDVPQADLLTLKGVGRARAKVFHTNARAFVSGQPVWHEGAEAVSLLPGMMLDLETLPEGGIWCFGWSETDGNTQVVVVSRGEFTEPLILPDGQSVLVVENSDIGWEMLADAANGRPIYHWSGYEQGVLRQTAAPHLRERLESLLHDLNRTFRQMVTVPTGSTSIKAVGPYLGYQWPQGANASNAYFDFERWRMDNDRAALARACAYQRADVESLALIWRWLTDAQRNGTIRA